MEIKDTNTPISEPWYLEWRLIGAYVFYMITLFDFVIEPIINTFVNAYFKTSVVWTPLTTQGGGLFFFAYGGILGISAWGKFNENKEMLKINQSNTQSNS